VGAEGESEMKRLAAGALLAAGLSTGVAAQDFEAGRDAYAIGDYQTALTKWIPLAEAGDARAQIQVAGMYDVGEGVEENNALAVGWYRKAAKLGDTQAQATLANKYWTGSGLVFDEFLAYVWFDVAARNGSLYAQSRRDAIEHSMSPTVVASAKVVAQWCYVSDYAYCP
jgi:TPR repeat protein